MALDAAGAGTSQLLYLAEDVPAGLDYDGPSVSVNTSQVGFINLMEPLIYYPYAPSPTTRASGSSISIISRAD